MRFIEVDVVSGPQNTSGKRLLINIDQIVAIARSSDIANATDIEVKLLGTLRVGNSYAEIKSKLEL